MGHSAGSGVSKGPFLIVLNIASKSGEALHFNGSTEKRSNFSSMGFVLPVTVYFGPMWYFCSLHVTNCLWSHFISKVREWQQCFFCYSRFMLIDVSLAVMWSINHLGKQLETYKGLWFIGWLVIMISTPCPRCDLTSVVIKSKGETELWFYIDRLLLHFWLNSFLIVCWSHASSCIWWLETSL